MPSVLTGANLANRDLIYIGVSGDGDSASIGLGQFAHCVRRGLNMTYICENNGVYGLTKGQFSATADKGSRSKTAVNNDQPIDLVGMALLLGATYVGRSFSGDKKQLVPLLKGAILHKGMAVIDIVSPCVQFNNTPQSTKSYDFVREHNDAVNMIDFIVPRAEIKADYEPGTVTEVKQHDGSVLRLNKLDPSYDPHNRAKAMAYLQERHAAGEVVTGLLYIEEDADDLHHHLNTAKTPLNQLGEKALCPGSAKLAALNEEYR
jgi:2-oxoglutarate ferredoxin oxidoreductase subunit beta